MGIEINVMTNIKELNRKLNAFAYRQVPFATGLALTALARGVKGLEEENIKAVFPTATPFTTRSIGVKPATKYTQEAIVYMKDIAARYLLPYEQQGAHLPWKGQKSVFNPIEVVPDQFGNIPRGTVRRLLARKDVFIGVIHGHMGIWQRPMKEQAYRKGKPGAGWARGFQNDTGKLKLLVAIGRPLQVRQALHYHQLAAAYVRTNFNKQFGRAIAKAMATAK